MTQSDILREFAAIDGYIKATREIAAAGHMPDMRGLDKRIADLCDHIAAAAPEDQQPCLPLLNALADKLNTCEEDVRALRAAQLEGVAHG